MEKSPALPKNIRQIGEISGSEKVCIEDYVMTYIRKREQQEEKGYLGIFFGERQETEDSVFVFIRGVFEVPEDIQDQQVREGLREEYEKYFKGWSVLGCCVIGIYPTERMKALAAWIPETGKLIYHLQEQEETLYWVDEEQYRRLRGYFVFYEQNLQMQEYLAQVFRDSSVEKESAPDRAIQSFRAKVREKGEIKQSNLLRMASSFFVITVLVIGAIVVNRVEDIRNARSLPLADEEIPAYQAQQEGETMQSASSGSATWQVAQKIVAQQDTAQQGAAQQEVAGQDGSSGDVAAQDSAVQSDAVQKADQEAKLTGSDAFWAAPDLEDATEQQPAEASGASDTAGAAESFGTQEAPGAAEASGTQETSGTAEASVTQETSGAAEAVGTMETSGAAEASGTQEALSAAEASGTPETPGAAETSGTSGMLESNGSAAETTEPESAREAAAVRSTQSGYVIKEGDTLAAICSRYYGTLDRIAEVCEANHIEDANMIMPGQRIVLP